MSAMARSRPQTCRARSRSKPPWQRILVMLAGPAANILFAIVVLWGMFWINGVTHVKAAGRQRDCSVRRRPLAGLRSRRRIRAASTAKPIRDQGDVVVRVVRHGQRRWRGRHRRARPRWPRSRHLQLDRAGCRPSAAGCTEPQRAVQRARVPVLDAAVPARVGKVIAGGPAAQAGIKAGDQIVAANGAPIRSYNEFVDYINARPGRPWCSPCARDEHRQGRVKLATASEVGDGARSAASASRFRRTSASRFPPSMKTHSDAGTARVARHCR